MAPLMAAPLHTRFLDHLARGIEALQSSGDLPAGIEPNGLTVERPHDPAHGDLSTNAAMVLANLAGAQPRPIAEKLAEWLATLDEIAEATVAGPGFINLRLTDQAWRDELAVIAEQMDRYGRSALGAGRGRYTERTQIYAKVLPCLRRRASGEAV